MATGTPEAIVVGAGIAGAAVAFHLARRGLPSVVGVEASTPAAGATGRAAGIVSEQLWDRWDVDVVRESAAEYAAFSAREAPGAYRRNGFARWTADARVGAALRERTAQLRTWGVDVALVEPPSLGEHLPGLRTDDLLAASFAPGDAVVAPSLLAETYVRLARNLGVDWRLGHRASRLRLERDGWVVAAGADELRAPRLIVAAGAWSKRLLADAGFPLPVAPYRTQAALLAPSNVPEREPASGHDLDLDVYARPEENGRILAGDGTERVEADPETFAPSGDATFVAHLADSFERRFRGWREARVVRAWAGVCTATPDRRPLIGEVPDAPGLYVLTGFNGFGVMRAGGAAARLADLITRSGPNVRERLATVAPGRFGAGASPFSPKPGFTLDAGVDPAY